MAGNLVGSWIAYALGYFGRLELVERHRIFHGNKRYLDWADDWFNRHGDATVFFSRMLPIIRTFISLPAGVARMPFWRFTVLTLAGCIPWVFALGLLGKEVGSNWDDWKDRLHYLDYAGPRRNRRTDRLRADPPPAGTGRASHGDARELRRCAGARRRDP